MELLPPTMNLLKDSLVQDCMDNKYYSTNNIRPFCQAHQYEVLNPQRKETKSRKV